MIVKIGYHEVVVYENILNSITENILKLIIFNSIILKFSQGIQPYFQNQY
jgi:hypothetical protein